MADLRAHWPRALSGYDALCRRLIGMYDGGGRSYHDLRHLTEVLQHVEEILAHEDPARADPDAIRLAAWFHDAVYDEHGDLEERSAALAQAELSAAGLDAALVEEVVRLVRLTALHDPAPGDVNGAVLCDADLAILAADEARYADYATGVRREYAHVPDEAFRAGRAAVLRTLLAHERLYSTPYAFSRWEQRARANLARELAVLSR